MAYHNPDGIVEKEKKKAIKVRFESEEDMIAFGKKIGITITKAVKIVDFKDTSAIDDLFN